MPEPKSEHKNILGGYVQDFFSLIFSELSESVERMIRRLGEFVILKRIVKQYAVFLAMMTAGLITLLYGIGAFISSFFPSLKPGLAHVFIALAFMAIAMAYRKSKSGSD